METIMCKILLTALGSAAMLAAVGQTANAKDRHHVRHVEQRSTIFTTPSAREANAQYRIGSQMNGYHYNGGYSAPAGR
jgi:hypothetical protein